MSTVPAAPPVPAPNPVDPATIASWPAHRAEVADRLGPAPTQRRALAYLDGLPAGRSARTAGNWRKSTAMSTPTASSTC
ncbi:MAG: hypothetical protein OXC13_20265 [Caldilineaceae bacterium]|nr:hypothetical protein [Caldilineaceae bacterium]